MSANFASIAFTPAVRALQVRNGSRAQYARMEARSASDGLGTREAAFLAHRDSVFLATVSETGWPYVQHRGGPAGFIRVLDPHRIAFADFGGNRQYVSAGNASRDDRVAIIAIDYAHRQRLKLLGHLQFADVADAAPELLAAVDLPGYPARVERIATIEVAAFDWNCPQHITERHTLEEIEAATAPLRSRIAELEAQLAARAPTTP